MTGSTPGGVVVILIQFENYLFSLRIHPLHVVAGANERLLYSQALVSLRVFKPQKVEASKAGAFAVSFRVLNQNI